MLHSTWNSVVLARFKLHSKKSVTLSVFPHTTIHTSIHLWVNLNSVSTTHSTVHYLLRQTWDSRKLQPVVFSYCQFIYLSIYLAQSLKLPSIWRWTDHKTSQKEANFKSVPTWLFLLGFIICSYHFNISNFCVMV